MASLYTDEERAKRYDVLRPRKRALEILRVICFWGILIMTVFGITGFDENIPAIISVICAVSGAVSAYTRNAYLAAVPIPVCILLACISGSFVVLLPVLLYAATVYLGIQWKKLSQEEGFPDFKIPLSEFRSREELHTAKAEVRAIAAGTRLAETKTDDDMHDLLDAGHETQAIAGKLSAYRERGQFAQAYETEREDILPEMKEL